MLERGLVEELRRYHDIPAGFEITCVRRGTNDLYKLTFPGSSRGSVALKISRCGEDGIERREAESLLLGSLSGRFPFVPILITPMEDSGYSWGFCDKGFTVSLYEWIGCDSYNGTLEHLKSAAERFARFHQAVLIEAPSFPHSGVKPDFLISAFPGGFEVREDFSFRPFREKLLHDEMDDATACFVLSSLDFLESEVQGVKEILDGKAARAGSLSVGIIHGEPSPSNFGFGKDGGVRMIFDFDSVRYGLRVQDIAWMLATFCIDHRSTVGETCRKIGAALSSLDAVFPLKEGERELLLPVMRACYLESIFRKLALRSSAYRPRIGFLKEDILALRWLKQYGRGLLLADFSETRTELAR